MTAQPFNINDYPLCIIDIDETSGFMSYCTAEDVVFGDKEGITLNGLHISKTHAAELKAKCPNLGRDPLQFGFCKDGTWIACVRMVGGSPHIINIPLILERDKAFSH